MAAMSVLQKVAQMAVWWVHQTVVLMAARKVLPMAAHWAQLSVVRMAHLWVCTKAVQKENLKAAHLAKQRVPLMAERMACLMADLTDMKMVDK